MITVYADHEGLRVDDEPGLFGNLLGPVHRLLLEETQCAEHLRRGEGYVVEAFADERDRSGPKHILGWPVSPPWPDR